MQNKKMLWSLGILIISSVLLLGQMSPSVVKVDVVSSVNKFPRGESHAIAIQLTLSPGWHINSNHPLEEFLIPTQIQLNAVDGISFGRLQYPQPVMKNFSFAEKPMAVYEKTVFVYTTIAVSPDYPQKQVPISGKITYQACNDQTCLPPTTISFQKVFPVAEQGEKVVALHPDIFQKAGGKAPLETASQEESSLARTIESKGLLLTFVVIFLSGLALNLTPCVYPLIPITLSYFGGQAGGKKGSLFIHAVLYVLGMAFTYSVLGVFAALTGQILGAWLQNPFVLLFIALVMVALALSMFGLYEIRIPPALARFAGQSKQGYFGTVFMGLTVGIIAAPCIGPFVLALFSYVGEKGNPVLGFWMFFVLAIGLGIPFIFLAVFSGAIQRLPRSGAWMVWVRKIFGFVLIAVAIYFLQPLLHHPLWYMGALALTFLIGGIYLAWIEPTQTQGQLFPVVRNLMGILFIGISLYVAVSGVDEYVHRQLTEYLAAAGTPTSTKAKVIPWQKYRPAVFQQAKANGKPIVIDFFADWCIPCKELDKFTFSDPAVIEKMQSFIAVKADLTRYSDPAVQKLKNQYRIKGVPTLVFLSPDGKELPDSRIVGFVDAKAFLHHLDRIQQMWAGQSGTNP